jgi:hypothetical protein
MKECVKSGRVPPRLFIIFHPSLANSAGKAEQNKSKEQYAFCV